MTVYTPTFCIICYLQMKSSFYFEIFRSELKYVNLPKGVRYRLLAAGVTKNIDPGGKLTRGLFNYVKY